MLVQHGILHPSSFSLSKSDISLPKVIIIPKHHEALSFKTLTACLHPCCSWGGPGTGKCGWNTSTLWPSSMLGHWNSLHRPQSTCLEQEGHLFLAELTAHFSLARRGAGGQQGLCRAGTCPSALLLSPACPGQVVLLLPLHLLGISNLLYIN